MPPSARQRDASGAARIAGLGLVTPIGRSAWETASALLAGRTAADRLSNLPDGAEPIALARATGGSCFAGFTATDPAVELAERAAREAINDAERSRATEVSSERPRAIIASSKGAVGALLGGFGPDQAAEAAALGPHGYLAGKLRERLGLGDVACTVSACATSLAALDQARRELESGCERVLVIAVESAMHAMFVESYRRLGALAPTSPAKEHRPRPLDRARAGFTVNESAAAILLERSDVFRAHGEKPHALLTATAVASQPHDLVRAAPRFKTLARLTRRVAPSDRPIALLQPHATGTPDNDEREMQALGEALGERAGATPVYASKGAMGHPLGAAGLINVVLGCLFARVGRRPSMPWLNDPIDTPFPLRAEAEPIEPGPQVCVSAGFGGHVAGACFDTSDNTSVLISAARRDSSTR